MVEDSGIGIAEEDQKKLFKFLGKVGANNEEINPDGAGLGLTICDKILGKFGSKLKVSSVVNEGT